MTGFEQRYEWKNGRYYAWYAQPIEPAPSPRQGWGRIDLAKSVPLPSALNPDASTTVANLVVLDGVDGLAFTASNQARAIPRARRRGTNDELRATLAWIDPPAAIVDGGALVNDLDLILYHLPEGSDAEPTQLWPLNGAWGTWDDTNNAERVVWSSPDAGRYWVEALAWSSTAATRRSRWPSAAGSSGGAGTI